VLHVENKVGHDLKQFTGEFLPPSSHNLTPWLFCCRNIVLLCRQLTFVLKVINDTVWICDLLITWKQLQQLRFVICLVYAAYWLLCVSSRLKVLFLIMVLGILIWSGVQRIAISWHAMSLWSMSKGTEVEICLFLSSNL
jgi:hypothetical protein